MRGEFPFIVRVGRCSFNVEAGSPHAALRWAVRHLAGNGLEVSPRREVRCAEAHLPSPGSTRIIDRFGRGPDQTVIRRSKCRICGQHYTTDSRE
jgi:hypothetical protein